MQITSEGVRSVAPHARHTHCAPVRRATATVARLTPCDSVACAIVSFRARSPRNESGLRSSSARHRRRSRPCICDQACCPLTLSVEKPLVGKVSAALPRDGRESRRRETGDHLPGRRCPCDCAGGAMVKMPSVAARAVPPVSVARLARCLVRPGWLNGVRCWARAQRHGGV